MNAGDDQVTISRAGDSPRAAARLAGISFVLSMVIVVFANYVLLSPLVVPGNASETAHNVLAHQKQFRFALTGQSRNKTRADPPSVIR